MHLNFIAIVECDNDASIILDMYSFEYASSMYFSGIKVHEERLGKISLISNLDKIPDEIYLIVTIKTLNYGL